MNPSQKTMKTEKVSVWVKNKKDEEEGVVVVEMREEGEVVLVVVVVGIGLSEMRKDRKTVV